MKIRSKLAWTYIILLIIGIITISTYSILSIRAYLLEQGINDFESDVKALSSVIKKFNSDELPVELEKLADLTGYEVAVYNEKGLRFLAFPDSVFSDSSEYFNVENENFVRTGDEESMIMNVIDPVKLIAYVNVENASNEARYIRVSQFKETYYYAIRSIRHIIYSGMLFSIIAVVIVSFMFARYMAAPIQFLNEAALDIAQGNIERNIEMRRADEFGTLSESLNKMSNKLKQDNEQLQKMNMKLQQFYADITHEIRNPLHTIVGSLEMMELDNLEEERKGKYLQTARRQALRLGRLFEDIKTLQRYDIDAGFLKKLNHPISEIVETVAENYHPLAEEKEIKLSAKCEGDCVSYVDPVKMEQVLDNLVSNAVKYSNKGEIVISCKQDHDHILVAVSDDGEGIDQEHIERLFDRFYRTDKARSRDKGGTGLGLSIVRSILKAHDSDIEVVSKPGVGSIFYFKLETVEESV